MMALLFILFTITIVLVWLKKPRAAVVLTLITLALCALMMIFHATDTLGIRL